MTIKEVSEKYGITPDTLRYYEKVGIIPPVPRRNGIRNYSDNDLGWVEQAICMRSAGISIEALIEYLRLFRIGDDTIPERLELLSNQRKILTEQKQQLINALDRLNYKISVYERAVQTGRLVWDDDCAEHLCKNS